MHMAKVDLNPFQSGGTVNPASVSGLKKTAMLMASFGLFFGLMSAGQATVQPVVESVLNMVPGVSTQQNDSGGAWRGW